MNGSPQCPLCRGGQVRAFAVVREREYFECGRCHLVFLSPAQRLDTPAERLHYSSHRNDPADERYRAFLNRLAAPLLKHLSPGMHGLDYGSGPGPTLSIMLQEAGMQMAIFDPLFAPQAQVLQHTYDFITCSEVVEHFHAPAQELDMLEHLLRAGGWLGVMTSMLLDEHRFAQWHYIRDPTHVCFYRPATMEWIAASRGWTLELQLPHVALFRKGCAS